MPSVDSEPTLDAEDVYVAVRRGVYDAVWDVLGTLAMTALSGLLVVVGASLVAAGLGADGPGALLGVAFGLVVATIGVLQLLREFDRWPFG